MPEFVPGIELARAFYAEAVAPLVGSTAHSAALLGYGSDVLGFDDARSTDHGWGPRLQVFVEGGAEALRARLDGELPERFRGWPVRYGWDDRPVEHHVVVAEPGEWLAGQLGFDPRGQIAVADWLTVPQQALLEVTAGAVFHDGLGVLGPVRESLAWYPHDVWLWLLGCQWQRVAQEEPFVGRTAEVGDELGSRLLAARLARDLVRLCFLLERRYAPYSKWLGSAFRRLDAHAAVGPPLERALAATVFAAREDALVEAVEAVAARHNSLGLTPPLDPSVRPFHARPFRVLDAGRFAQACLDAVGDEELRALPPIGAIDQLSDSTDLLDDPSVARRARALYEG